MYFYARATAIATVITLASTATVKWVPNGSFNLPINFKDGKLPCSKQTVIFPSTLTGSVKLESVVSISGLILPIDGSIVLDGEIALGDDGDPNCRNAYTIYNDTTTIGWNEAGAWSSPEFNEATPDTERIPCYGDIVEFPNTRYTAVLPNAEQYVRALYIGDDYYSTSTFRIRINSELDEEQNFVLNEFLATGVKIAPTECKSKFGCPCQANPLEINCKTKFCPKPSCVEPVKPNGFCCMICGGYITFDVDDNFDRKAFEELVNNTVKDYGRNLVYHIGFTPVILSRTIQLVVVETGEYTGASAEVINIIDSSVQHSWFKGEKLAVISGSPLSKAGMGGKIVVSVFFAVVLVIGAIYLYYYRLPPIDVPLLSRSSRGMFSRFQRRSDSVVSLTRRDSTVIGGVRTAFRNPLYDSKRGRVQVAESVVEE